MTLSHPIGERTTSQSAMVGKFLIVAKEGGKGSVVVIKFPE